MQLTQVRLDDLTVVLWLIVLVHLLRSAVKIIVLTDEGHISQQGSFHELDFQEGFVGSLHLEEHRNEELTELPHSVHQIKVSNSRLKDKPQGSDNDVTRRTGDLSVYQHYFRSVGWTSCLLLHFEPYICIHVQLSA